MMKISTTIIVPIIVAVITAVATIGQPVVKEVLNSASEGKCPTGYQQYTLKEGDELRKIARKYGRSQKDWKKIINPDNGEPYNSDEARRLETLDIVCIPKKW